MVMCWCHVLVLNEGLIDTANNLSIMESTSTLIFFFADAISVPVTAAGGPITKVEQKEGFNSHSMSIH